jgi:hypothetical protein
MPYTSPRLTPDLSLTIQRLGQLATNLQRQDGGVGGDS